MPNRTYSEQILLALDKHGRLNCRQLANQISHDQDKTSAIVSYMHGNKKIRRAEEMVDDQTAYELDDIGRHAVAKIKGVESTAAHTDTPLAPTRREPAAPRAAGLDDLADREIRRTSVEIAPPEEAAPGPMGAPAESAARMDMRMGILNTGELLIWPAGRGPVVLEAAHVASLRKLLREGAAA